MPCALGPEPPNFFYLALVIFKSSLAGSKLSPHMRAYLANTEICRREILLKSFGQQKQDTYSEDHNCCDLCSTSCTCEGCKLSPYQSALQLNLATPFRNKKQSKVPCVTENGTKELRSILLALDPLSGNNPNYLDISPETGFPSIVVEEVIEGQELLTSPEDIWLKTSILDFELAEEIFNILQAIRKDLARI